MYRRLLAAEHLNVVDFHQPRLGTQITPDKSWLRQSCIITRFKRPYDVNVQIQVGRDILERPAIPRPGFAELLTRTGRFITGRFGRHG